MKELYWRALEGASKVMPVIGAIIALALFAILATCAFVGAYAIQDGYWSFSW